MQSYCFSAAHCCAGQLALAVHVVAGGIKVTSLEIFLNLKTLSSLCYNVALWLTGEQCY
jgi:hypothetical protein